MQTMKYDLPGGIDAIVIGRRHLPTSGEPVTTTKKITDGPRQSLNYH